MNTNSYKTEGNSKPHSVALPYPKIANFFLFQVGWMACVVAAANGLPVVATTSCLLFIAIHLILTPQKRNDFNLIVICGFLGMVVDSTSINLGVFHATGQLIPHVAPLWLIALWMLFATSLRHSLAWLKDNYLLAAICGALFAPLAYYGGSKLGAIQLSPNSTMLSLLLIGAVWMVVTPLFFWLVKIQDGD